MAYAGGSLDWLERKTLDLRFRYTNSIPQSQQLTCIDIDDASLEKVGRWPWPRDEQAGMLAVLSELGAQIIVVDITYIDPQTARPDLPADLDLLTQSADLADEAAALVLPDNALRDAIAEAGNVYLAVHYDPDAWERSPEFAQVVNQLRRGETPSLPRRRPGRVGWHDAQDWPAAARLVLALEADPRLEPQAAAERLNLDPALTRRVFDRCRQYFLREYVRARLAENVDWKHESPDRVVRKLHAGLTDQDWADATPLRAGLLAAYRDVLGYDATVAKTPASLAQVAAAAVPVDAFTPAYFPLASAARGCGFVAFEPDPDGITRRLMLFARHHDALLGQLALIAGLDALRVPAGDLRADARGPALQLPLPANEGPLRIPLDERGCALVPWVAEADWTRQFTHVPADAVWSVYDRRRQIRQNERFSQESRYSFFGGNLVPGNEEYRSRLARVLTTPDGPARAALDSELRGMEVELAKGLAAPSTAAGQDAEFGRQLLAELKHQESRIVAANERLAQEIEETLAWLKPRVAEKICLLGYTATALADAAPTPTHPRAPGLIAHANLLNGLLTRRAVSWAPRWGTVLAAGLAGVVASLLSTQLAPRLAGAILALVIVAFAALAAWLFYAHTFWLALTPLVGVCLATGLSISAYRFVFLERDTRQLTRALSQYTSATLARKMAEDAELCRKAETREVSAMFTDLRGFTSISERIGAEHTQRVLNISLGRCSEILLEYEALINKFIGDGIFAFWNPLIYPQSDHAIRACRAALVLQTGVARLPQEWPTDPVFAELVLRIGIASGPAVVGPCGSEQKYDYTCIGDTVNVASRLESANKFYGTRILVSGSTRDVVQDEFVFRSLGGVQVKGKQHAVPIYELLGRSGDVPAPDGAYAEQFGACVEHFRRRGWDAARAGFERCLALRPDDLAAERYLAAVNACRATPPPEDWSGALELLEK